MSPNGSSERNSSAVSDYRSTSGKGGSSSESSIGANEQQFGVSPINNNSRMMMMMMMMSQPETIASDVKASAAAAQRPKPEALNSCLPRMPCVSTTGNGPNGKTVTGFLYRYTKTEVSIVCVCHGTSFSPAEFVEHAGGGTDVTNPLRHITMVPSPFAD